MGSQRRSSRVSSNKIIETQVQAKKSFNFCLQKCSKLLIWPDVSHIIIIHAAVGQAVYIYIYYIDTSVLLGTEPLVHSIHHFIRDSSGVFSVCHLCECRIVQWCHDSRLLLLLNWLNLLVYDRNTGSSSVVLDNLQKSSEIFGKCLEMFVWPSE